MKRGDLIQSKNKPDMIYLILDEVVDPEDGLKNFIFLDLRGIQREWCSDQIRKVCKVISAKR